MLKPKLVFYFLLKVAVFYSLIMLPVIFHTSYATFYRAAGNKFFNPFYETGFAQFTKSSDEYDTEITIGNYILPHPNGKGPIIVVPLSSRSGYLPTALLLSLVLSSPIGFRRKIVALLAGSFIVTAFVMFKLWIQILYNCYSTEWLKLQPTSLTTLKVVNYIYTNFIDNPGPSLYFSVLIWLLVSFRINDLNDFKKQ